MKIKIFSFSIYLFLALLPIFWLPFGTFPHNSFRLYLFYFLIPLAFLLFFGNFIFKEKKLIIPNLLFPLFILVFLIYLIFNTIFSVDKTISLFGIYGRFWPSFFGYLLLIIFYFLIIGGAVQEKSLTKNSLNSENKKSTKKNQKKENKIVPERIIRIFLFANFFLVFIIYLSLFGFWKLFGRKVFLLSLRFSPFSSASFVWSVYFSAILVFILSEIACFKLKKIEKVFFYLFCILICFLLILINFKTSFLIIALSTFFFLVISFWRRIFKKSPSSLGPIAFLFLLSLLLLFVNPFSQIISGPTRFFLQNTVFNKELLASQKASWQVGFGALKENPFLGVGLSNFQYAFSRFKPESLLKERIWQIEFDRGASQIAENFATLGIIGSLLWWSIFSLFFFLTFKKIKKTSLVELKRFLPYLTGFFAFFLSKLFCYENLILAIPFWLFFGLAIVSFNEDLSIITSKKKKKFFSLSRFNRQFKVSLEKFPEVSFGLTILFWAFIFGTIFFWFRVANWFLADLDYNSYLREGKIEYLERAVRRDPKEIIYKTNLARAYLEELKKESQKKNPDSRLIENYLRMAIDFGKELVKEHPNCLICHQSLASIYRDILPLVEGDALKWAEKEFKLALKISPKNPILLTELGNLKITKGEEKEAKELFDKAISFRADYFPAIKGKVSLLEKEKKIKEAEKLLQEFLNKNLFSVDGYFELGRLYYTQGDCDKAISNFRVAINLFPNHSNSLYLAALCYEKKQNFETALNLLKRVSQLNPENSQVKEVIARIEKKMRKGELSEKEQKEQEKEPSKEIEEKELKEVDKEKQKEK